MDKIKELTDFYMWMQENDYDHNIRARVEKKAKMYLNNTNGGQKLPIHNVSNRRELLIDFCSKVEETLEMYGHLAPNEAYIDEYLKGN